MTEPEAPGTEACAHDKGEWFDRTICEEPCGSMHSRCTECGTALGHGCRWERGETPPSILAIEAEAVAEYRKALAEKVRAVGPVQDALLASMNVELTRKRADAILAAVLALLERSET